MTKYNIVPINSKEEAIQHGKDRGWCTAEAEGYKHYESTYSKDKGDLFVLYEEGKKRPQYQLFISKHGSIEFRKKFNVAVNFSEFMSKDKILKEWFDKAYKGLVNKYIGRGRLPITVGFDPACEGGDSHVYYTQHTALTIKLIMDYIQYDTIIHVHNREELPGDLEHDKLYLVDNRYLMIYSPQFNFQKFHLIRYQTQVGNGGYHGIQSPSAEFELIAVDNSINVLDFLQSLPQERFQWSIIRQQNQSWRS